MRERPILFSGPMVRAILEGRKTQTRRVLSARLPCDAPATIVVHTLEDDKPARWGFFDSDGDDHVCPFGGPGDRLWVREAFAPVDGNGHKCAPADASFVVLADGAQKYRDGVYFPPLPEYQQSAFDGIKWRPSIHMPRWASRITLEVTDVRVERLQDITEADAIAEGVTPAFALTAGTTFEVDDSEFADARTAYHFLWDGINGKRAPWSSNPWVWVVSFKRLEAA